MSFKRINYYFFKITLGILLVAYFLFVVLYGLLFMGPAPVPVPDEQITWGINFSQRQAVALGLDWQETFLALADDLGAEYWRIPVYWDELEVVQGEYDFTPWDWQIKQLEQRGAKVILAVGFRLPRWPECHAPGWTYGLNQTEFEQRLFQYIRNVVAHYRDSDAIVMWQVENEPFLWPFGECPKPDADLLDTEIELVRGVDPSRPIMITDSGEWSFWVFAGRRADVFGSTLYRIIHDPRIGFLEYKFFTPTFHWRKGVFLRWFKPDIPIQVIELQAEPWARTLPLSEVSFEEQDRTMNPEQFSKNIEFAKATGYDTFYLWGAEWWYWLKSTQNKPEIWNLAKELFMNK